MRRLVEPFQKKKTGEKKRRWRIRVNYERRVEGFKLKGFWKLLREAERRFERQFRRENSTQ